jgi:metal-responsive CopG/Arc/MetJ family transcriptional regulator
MPKRGERKIPFNCYLTSDQLDELDALAEADSMSKAEIIREAVTEYISKRIPPGEDPVKTLRKR